MTDPETKGEMQAARPNRASIWKGLAALITVGFALWLAWDWGDGRSDAERQFLVLAEAGKAALSRVERVASFGTDHLNPGQTAYYRHRFPTSGPHAPVWVEPGVYATVQPPNQLVHSIERGMIVVYYDAPADDILSTLRGWAALFDGPWSGLVVVPSPGIDDEIVLTAWNHMLRLDPFEPESAAAFIHRFRGRGPKSPEK